MRFGKREMSFWGEISDLGISKIVKTTNALVNRVIKLLVGGEFFDIMDRKEHNIDIVSMFIAIILHVDLDKDAIRDFWRDFFKKPIIKELDIVLETIEVNLCIPKRSDFGVLIHHVQVFPILEIKNPWNFTERIEEIVQNLMFLLVATHTGIYVKYKGRDVWYHQKEGLY